MKVDAKILPTFSVGGNVTVIHTNKFGKKTISKAFNNVCTRLLTGIAYFVSGNFTTLTSYTTQSQYIPKYMRVGTGNATQDGTPAFAVSKLAQEVSIGSSFSVYTSELQPATSSSTSVDSYGKSRITFVSYIQPGTIPQDTVLHELALYGSTYTGIVSRPLAYVYIEDGIKMSNDSVVQVLWQMVFSNASTLQSSETIQGE